MTNCDPETAQPCICGAYPELDYYGFDDFTEDEEWHLECPNGHIDARGSYYGVLQDWDEAVAEIKSIPKSTPNSSEWYFETEMTDDGRWWGRGKKIEYGDDGLPTHYETGYSPFCLKDTQAEALEEVKNLAKEKDAL